MSNTDPRIIAALLKAAEKSEQSPTQVAQGYLLALEEPALRILCAILKGNPDIHPDFAVKQAWELVSAFATEKMSRGEKLIEELTTQQ